MNEKPLDLSKPVQTRDGRPARIVSTNLNSIFSIGAVVTDTGGREYLDSFMPDGTEFEGSSRNDLVNVPERKTAMFWVNVYPYAAPVAHSSADTAIEERSASGTTVKVTVDYVEGEDQL